MHIATMLWIDLRNQSNQSCLSSSFEGICHTQTVKQSSAGPRSLDTTGADLICFEYDYPDIQSLHLLQKTRLSDPDLPILMFTEQHSEALAVWAFRTGVWDYHVKPLSEVDMAHITESLKTASEFREAIKLRNVRGDSEPLPEEVRFRAPTSGESILQGAINYVQNHYPEKILETDMAELCGLTVNKFSRLFKQTYNLTFQEYLIGYRLTESTRLLLNPIASISDVAFTVGFNAPSYYARVFKKYMGLSPSECRQILKEKRSVEEIDTRIMEMKIPV